MMLRCFAVVSPRRPAAVLPVPLHRPAARAVSSPPRPHANRLIFILSLSFRHLFFHSCDFRLSFLKKTRILAEQFLLYNPIR